MFAHAKVNAKNMLSNVDVLALSGNSAMIDPLLFGQERQQQEDYDFSRTISELALIHVATQEGMPILAVWVAIYLNLVPMR